jgi:hypothetical protein
MLGVTPPPLETLPVPGSSGAGADPVVANLPEDAEYGGAVAAVAEVVELLP